MTTTIERKNSISYILSADDKVVTSTFGIRIELLGGNTKVEISKRKSFGRDEYDNAEISYPSAGLPRPSVEEVLIFSEMLKEAAQVAESLDKIQDFESYLMTAAQIEVDDYWAGKE